MQASLFAAGFAGIAVGAKLSWRQVVDRVRGEDPTDDRTASVPEPSGRT
jgi:hypothetical protein